MVYNVFKKIRGSGAKSSANEEPAQKLHKPVIEKFKRRKVYARFKDNIWAADLAVMGSLFSKNRDVKYLLCVIDDFTKYSWAKRLKNKKAETALRGLVDRVNKSKHKPNKLWVGEGEEIYNNPME